MFRLNYKILFFGLLAILIYNSGDLSGPFHIAKDKAEEILTSTD